MSIAGTFNGNFTNEAGGAIADDGTYNGADLIDTNSGVLTVGGVLNFDTLFNYNTMTVNGGVLTGNGIVNGGTASMSQGTLALALFRDGDPAKLSTSASASLVLTNGSIAELEIGLNPGGGGPSVASSLILNQSTLSAGDGGPGITYALQVGAGTLDLTHDSSLTDVFAIVAGGSITASVSIDASTWTNTSAFTGLTVGEGAASVGVVTLANGGVLSSATISVDAGSTIVGSGTVDSNSIDLSNGGVITAAGGPLLVKGTVTQGTLTIEAAATLEMAGENDAKSTDFAATAGTLRVDTPHLSFSTIDNFGGRDSILLTGVSVDTKGYSGSSSLGTLSLGLSDTTTAKLLFSGGYTLDSFNVATVGSDTDITFVACFAEGTRIATVAGAVAVQHLCAGDFILTAAGRDPAPVQWLGQRRVHCARHQRPQDVWPIRVRVGAFEAGVPARDLLLSPDHAVFCEGDYLPLDSHG